MNNQADAPFSVVKVSLSGRECIEGGPKDSER
jgi:hypothetical protein